LTPNVLFKCEYFQKGRKGYSFYSSKDTSNDYLSYVNNGVIKRKKKSATSSKPLKPRYGAALSLLRKNMARNI